MNKHHRKRFDAIARLGCVICGRPPHIHHIRHGGKRDNDKTFGLCPDHHQFGGYGVAIHAGLETWERNFNTEQFYLDYTNKIIGG